MGGQIKVAIRLHDGEMICDTRWTNALPSLLNSWDMVLGDDPNYLRDYAHESDLNRSNEDQFIAPSGYGLVVIDAMTKTIWSANGYMSPGQIATAHIILMRPREGLDGFVPPKPAQPELAYFQRFMDEGRITAYDDQTDTRVKLPVVPGRDIVEECYALRKRDNEEDTFFMLHLDLSPWRVMDYRETREGYEEMCRALQESDFPMRDIDLVAFHAAIEEKFRHD